MNRQTTHAKNNEVPQNWRHIDATDQIMGRLASQIAVILQGKDKPQYTPHCDVGDFVIVTNVEKIRLTGAKMDQKFYKTYSGHPGGLFRWFAAVCFVGSQSKPQHESQTSNPTVRGSNPCRCYGTSRL